MLLARLSVVLCSFCFGNIWADGRENQGIRIENVYGDFSEDNGEFEVAFKSKEPVTCDWFRSIIGMTSDGERYAYRYPIVESSTFHIDEWLLRPNTSNPMGIAMVKQLAPLMDRTETQTFHISLQTLDRHVWYRKRLPINNMAGHQQIHTLGILRYPPNHVHVASGEEVKLVAKFLIPDGMNMSLRWQQRTFNFSSHDYTTLFEEREGVSNGLNETGVEVSVRRKQKRGQTKVTTTLSIAASDPRHVGTYQLILVARDTRILGCDDYILIFTNVTVAARDTVIPEGALYLQGLTCDRAKTWNATSPEVLTFQYGQPDCLMCYVFGNPKPNVTFFKNTSAVTAEDGLQIIHNERGMQQTTMLLFPRPSRVDRGHYTCRAESKSGQLMWDVQLRVKRRAAPGTA